MGGVSVTAACHQGAAYLQTDQIQDFDALGVSVFDQDKLFEVGSPTKFNPWNVLKTGQTAALENKPVVL